MSGLVRLKRLDLGTRRRGFAKASRVEFKVDPRRQRHGSLDADQVGPVKEIAKYGVESSDLSGPLSSSGASSGGSVDADIRRNAFNANLEPGEKEKTLEPEKPSSTARFWLLAARKVQRRCHVWRRRGAACAPPYC